LFIADIKALDRIVAGKNPHVYFCSGATAQLIEDDRWATVFRMISDTSFITIEVTGIGGSVLTVCSALSFPTLSLN
jgi:hypothetical protein